MNISTYNKELMWFQPQAMVSLKPPGKQMLILDQNLEIS